MTRAWHFHLAAACPSLVTTSASPSRDQPAYPHAVSCSMVRAVGFTGSEGSQPLVSQISSRKERDARETEGLNTQMGYHATLGRATSGDFFEAAAAAVVFDHIVEHVADLPLLRGFDVDWRRDVLGERISCWHRHAQRP